MQFCPESTTSPISASTGTAASGLHNCMSFMRSHDCT
jgi:hypothetical protein